jgi:aminopeptidase N
MKETYLKDYKAPSYYIDTVDLSFELSANNTRVKSVLSVRANENIANGESLFLNGEDLTLEKIILNGVELSSKDYELVETGLIIKNLPAHFTLEITNTMNPEANTRLSGLYLSEGALCTQCEAEGFRRITYYVDRPDNLAIFKTTIIADKKEYPVLLSNGNLIESTDLGNGKMRVVWEDPFKKPCYLFALVAGKLDVLEDHFITCSGRRVELKIFVDPGEVAKASYAMEALKKSMRWDEVNYGREYDLDIFMIVAVRFFNFGAMENKGLNVFNSKYVLANPEMATDLDYERILAVIGHEYFHNWTGNRITCRDWFQLSLKEGLTVFRDQTFTADNTSPAIKRIDDVNTLRTFQFTEDAGPMSHPVQPKHYLKIDNFYTVTIYEKGAEVIRMMHTLLGQENFRRGTDLYFERHDGQAVTIEEFVKAMEDGGKVDLTQFRAWYDEAGTPHLKIKDHFDVAKKCYTLTVEQSMPKKTKDVTLHIPLSVGLLNKEGVEIVPTKVLDIKTKVSNFQFENIERQPIVSLLRGFSAPVKIDYDYKDADLSVLLAHDTDSFSRWEAGQKLALKQLDDIDAHNHYFFDGFNHVLKTDFDDPAFKALLLSLPSQKYLIELGYDVNVEKIDSSYWGLSYMIALKNKDLFMACYEDNVIKGDYKNNVEHNAKRRLKNMCLHYLSLLDQGELAAKQYKTSNNMTDTMAALSALTHIECYHRDVILEDFYTRWQSNSLVLDKWFAVQAVSRLPGTLQEVKRLTQHEKFDIKNPNTVRSLIGAFAGSNYKHFHAVDGSGYNFLADEILKIDALNGQLSSRLVEPLTQWKKFNKAHQTGMHAALKRIADTKTLSSNLLEIVERSV